MIREYDIPEETFIGGNFISENLCDDIINYFEFNKVNAIPGEIYRAEDGSVVDKDVKASFDFPVSANSLHYPISNYRVELQMCLDSYLKKYPFANELNCFSIKEQYNIQKYPINGGFKTWHFERPSASKAHRLLVFMTYLNDVEDGGTEFYHQKFTCPAKKGLTLIWPADWTHTHRGLVSQTKEKYIITGWYSFNDWVKNEQ